MLLLFTLRMDNSLTPQSAKKSVSETGGNVLTEK